MRVVSISSRAINLLIAGCKKYTPASETLGTGQDTACHMLVCIRREEFS
jgi:hypothetical protein